MFFIFCIAPLKYVIGGRYSLEAPQGGISNKYPQCVFH